MQLYAGTSKDFISDATRNGIASKLERAFLDAFHYKPSLQEVMSWQNSLFRMAFALQQGDFMDHGVLLEYQLPLSSRRLDCMVTGHSEGGQAYSVIVELKQWSDVEESNAEDCVTTWVAGSKKDILHPSRQVGQYEEYLRDMHSVFVRGEVGLRSCAFLHNLTYSANNEIYSPRHAQVLKLYPAFAGDQQDGLINYMGDHLRGGGGAKVLDDVLKSKFAPSKKLLEHTSQVVQDQKAYVLLDSQQVVFAKVLAEAREGAKASKLKKTVVLVHGGPGTGKSVIALHLLGRLSGEGLNVMHLTGSKAFTENMRKVVGSRASAQFGYFNVNKKGELPPNQFDALVLDEAHRIRESSKDRFTRPADWSGLPQIDELVHIARVSVFFIDDRQIVRPGEVGSSDLIREAAKRAGAKLLEYELDAQFRCSGSDAMTDEQWSCIEPLLAVHLKLDRPSVGRPKRKYEVRELVDVMLNKAIRGVPWPQAHQEEKRVRTAIEMFYRLTKAGVWARMVGALSEPVARSSSGCARLLVPGPLPQPDTAAHDCLTLSDSLLSIDNLLSVQTQPV